MDISREEYCERNKLILAVSHAIFGNNLPVKLAPADHVIQWLREQLDEGK